MMTASTPYRTFRFPAKLIQQAVWLHHCFSLSLRDVELILATRSVAVSYESIREWGLRFGRLLANILKRRRPKPGDMWRLDGVLMLSTIGGGLVSAWRCSMSLHPEPIGEVSAETVRVARAAFPKGTVVMRLRDEFSALYEDEGLQKRG